MGKAIRRPVSFRQAPAVRADLEALAARERCTLSAAVDELLRGALRDRLAALEREEPEAAGDRPDGLGDLGPWIKDLVARLTARPGPPTPEERRLLVAARDLIGKLLDRAAVRAAVAELTKPGPAPAGEE